MIKIPVRNALVGKEKKLNGGVRNMIDVSRLSRYNEGPDRVLIAFKKPIS